MSQEFEWSDQQIATVMMILQRALLTEEDAVPLFRSLRSYIGDDGKSYVRNPPLVEFPKELLERSDEEVQHAVEMIKNG